MPVHPHTRGEICLKFRAMDCAPGSPPHAWGDRWGRRHALEFVRFTPTRVGRSFGSRSTSSPHTVHPHTRGEIKSSVLVPGPVGGSPPHAWGDRHGLQVAAQRLRFTPTRVGRSEAERRGVCHMSVHSHTRGEIACSVVDYDSDPGSPPHAWGDLLVADGRGGPCRFTPTRVGRSHHEAL